MANKQNTRVGDSGSQNVGGGQHGQRAQGNSEGMKRPPEMKREKGGVGSYKSNQKEGNHGGNR